MASHEHIVVGKGQDQDQASISRTLSKIKVRQIICQYRERKLYFETVEKYRNIRRVLMILHNKKVPVWLT